MPFGCPFFSADNTIEADLPVAVAVAADASAATVRRFAAGS